MTDDPERRFRRFPAALRRWSWRAINRRLRLPFRRRAWDAQNRALTRPYLARDADAPGRGRDVVYALGDFSGKTGLSRAGLYELEKLRAEYPDLIVRDLGPAIHLGAEVVPEDGPPVDRLYLLSAPDTYGIVLPALPPERLCHACRTGLWVWETPAFPRHWRFAVDLVDEVWTPSEYSRAAIAPTVAPRPTLTRPHAVTTPLAIPSPEEGNALRARFGIAETAFMGLAIMDVSSCPARKNPWAHVAAWQRAFGDDPSCVLLLKIRVSKTTRVVLAELAELIGGAGNIRVVEAELTGDEIMALQRTADAYLSLHRAEGYGLNIHECLSLGTPVVATDYSANAEYGPDFTAYHPVSYRLVPYRDWTGHYEDRDFSWAEADLENCAEILQGLKADAISPP